MVTVTVAVILLVLALPSFQQLIIANRITAQTNNLVADLALARSEAIKRGITIAVCAANAGHTDCDSAVTTDWSNGRLVYVEQDGTAGAIAGSDVVLRYTEALKGGITLVSANITNNRYIQYFPSGRVDDDGTLTVCKSGYTGRVISISVTGRVETSNLSC